MPLLKLILAFSLLAASGAQAVTNVAFDPSDSNVAIGETFDVAITANSDEIVVGGGIRLDFDPTVLRVTGVTINTTLFGFLPRVDDSNPDDGTVELIGFGANPGVDPIGSFTIATVRFEAIGAGTTALTASDPNDLFYPWSNDLANPIIPIFSAGSTTVSGPTVTVPDVVGDPQASAEAAIVAAGLAVGVVTTANSDTVPAGSVISQDPAGGSTVDAGSAVNLVVSLGVAQVTVPNVVGLAQATAETAIVNADLVVGVVTTANSDTVPAGDVISQDPAGGSSVDAGSAVNLVVSLGVAQVTVPNVVGLAQDAAETAIVNADLVVGVVTTANSDTVPAGDVISQDPTGGSTVNAGSAVNLVISLGVAQVTVPNVVGLAQAAAETAIVNADLVVGVVTTVNSDTVPAGNVISQDPAGGSTVDSGSAVNLVISLGVAQVTVPNVVGLAQAAAETAIVNADLVVGVVTTVNSDTVPAGNVISQDPAGGSTVDTGSAVNLVVSLGVAQLTVPNVVGLAQAVAETAIVNADLVVGVVTTANSDTVPAGSVISQDPAGGSTVDSGSAVNLVVSLGVAQVTVPNVVGLAQAAAETAIVNADLVVGTVTTANSDTVPAGDVISQDPAGGSTVDSGSAVNLVVSLGVAQVTVPNVVGLAQATAETAIVNADLVVGVVTTANSDTVPAGSVISQDPVGGSTVDAGSAVNLVVSLGVAQVTVPDVVGQPLAAAETAIVNADLVVGTVDTANSDTVPAGSVISQDPAGGSTVDTGAAVNLVVSIGAAQVTVPDVVGLSQAAAETTIVNADLVVGVVTTANSDTVPAGSVISQDPPGGATVDSGSAVNLIVSIGSGNQPPEFEPVDDQNANEGLLLEFTIEATDPNGDALRFEAANLPPGSSFIDNGDNTATFSWTPDFDQAGNFEVMFMVFDDQDPPGRDDLTVNITVGDVNRPPAFIPAGDETRSVNENELLLVMLEAVDPDGNNLFFDVSSLPTGASFTDNGDGTADFEWTPNFGQAGNFEVEFIVTDDGDPVLEDRKTIMISVGNVNRPPVLDPIGNRTTDTGAPFSFLVTATDPDGDNLSFEATNLPDGASLTDNGDGTAAFNWEPLFTFLGDTGPITITVFDDGIPQEMDFETFVITVVLPIDPDADGDFDRDDIDLVFAARNQPASGPDDRRDLNKDGVITIRDVRAVVLLCTRPGCATN